MKFLFESIPLNLERVTILICYLPIGSGVNIFNSSLYSFVGPNPDLPQVDHQLQRNRR